MDRYIRFKEKIFEIIEHTENENIWHRIFDRSIIALIVLNIIAVVTEPFFTDFDVNNSLTGWIFYDFEAISVFVFSLEYLLRLWTSDLKYKTGKGINDRRKFIFSPMGLVDLLAILPFYLPMIIPVDLRILRILRLLRLLRILKLNRYTESFKMLGRVFKSKKDELIITVMIVSLLLIISSTLMFEIEKDSENTAFKNIFTSFWWAIATLTTVGYGDVYPTTVLGKAVSSFIALAGIGLVALPTGIISSGFIEEFRSKKKAEHEDTGNYCPHCGKKIKE